LRSTEHEDNIFHREGWAKSTYSRFGRCVQQRDMSACEIWHQWYMLALSIFRTFANDFPEPQYQNETRFPLSMLLRCGSANMYNCRSEVSVLCPCVICHSIKYEGVLDIVRNRKKSCHLVAFFLSKKRREV
jgi:hypothetical protein